MITVRLIRALKFRQRWCLCVHSRAGEQSLRAAPVDPENGSSTASVFTTGAGIGMSAKHFVSIHRSTLFCPLFGVTCVEIHGHPWLCPFPRAAEKCGGKYHYAATESGRSSRGSSPCGECPARQNLPILLLGRHDLRMTREIRILIRYTSQTRTDRSSDL